MKTIILILSLVIISNLSLSAQQPELEKIDSQIKEFYQEYNLDMCSVRKLRFINKPKKSYLDDNDSETIDGLNLKIYKDYSELILLLIKRNKIKVNLIINKNNQKPYPSKSKILNTIDPIDLVFIG